VVDRFKAKQAARRRRHNRIRSQASGTAERPRLCVFRSNKNVYCQLIDDEKQATITHASTMEKEMREKLAKRAGKEAAKEVGKRIAQKAKALGIKKVWFDRAGYKYHGIVKELADGAREEGLEF
jgi:large subunit ribosomal protein L18